MGIMRGHFEFAVSDQLLLVGGRSIYILHQRSKGVPAAMGGVMVCAVRFLNIDPSGFQSRLEDVFTKFLPSLFLIKE